MEGEGWWFHSTVVKLLNEWVYRYDEIVGDEKQEVDLEEDIKDIDQQDRYEHLYNTRFEQENLVTYPR